MSPQTWAIPAYHAHLYKLRERKGGGPLQTAVTLASSIMPGPVLT